MPFDILSPRLQGVASKALAQCKKKYGNTAFIDVGIDPTIQWRPTFYLKPSKSHIIAVEVEDNLYPSVLRDAAQDILHFDMPISIYQACSLDAFLTDPKQINVERLKKHGIGIITVDDDGAVVFQHSCVPLGQHISPEQYEREAKNLSPQIRRPFNLAYGVYQSNAPSGLQKAGQIVEGIVNCFAERAVKTGVLPSGSQNAPAASIIDKLYASNQFAAHRAALGGVRDFMKEYRNVVSHAPRSAKQAAERDRSCKSGFADAIKLSIKLKNVGKIVNYPIRLHID